MWKNCFTPLSAFKYCFVAVLFLVVTMALISKYDAHPDEKNHLSAAVYYSDHSLPPVIGDPAVRDSYSIWGISYLNYQWAEYFFAGKEGYPNYLDQRDVLCAQGRRYARLLSKYTHKGKILDVGCAAGFVLKGFEQSGWKGYGIDKDT